MEFHKLSACEIARGVKEKRFTAEEVARRKAEAKARAAEYMDKGKKQLNRVADALEKLDDAEADDKR